MTFLFGGQLYLQNYQRYRSLLMPLGRTNKMSGKAKKLTKLNSLESTRLKNMIPKCCSEIMNTGAATIGCNFQLICQIFLD